jgi:type II secretory pathway pseudopilin PulG
LSIAKQAGVTLLETILALVIASSLTIMGLRAYYGWQNELALSQIGEDVGLIFDAMKLYYYGNCAAGASLGQISTTPVVVLSGSINLLTPYLSQPIQTQNPLVNTTDSNTYYGYIAQFNLHTSSRIPPSTSYMGDGSTVVGTIVGWTSQVAVELKNTNLVPGVASGLGAECTSTYQSMSAGVYNCATPQGGTPAVPAVYVYNCYYVSPTTGGGCGITSNQSTPCNNTYCISSGYTIDEGSSYMSQPAIPAIPAPTATYVEFEQTPSYGSGNNTLHANYLPMLKVFNNQYQHSQYQGFETGGLNVGSSGSYQTNYYYCGS